MTHGVNPMSHEADTAAQCLVSSVSAGLLRAARPKSAARLVGPASAGLFGVIRLKSDPQKSALRRIAQLLVAGAMTFALAACSSGDGGKDVTIGSGQSADPVTLDFPVFYVRRPVPDPDSNDVQPEDARIPLRFDIGADLYMRDRASASSPEINLTAAETEGLGDIRDIAVNFDGSKVVFSMRAKFIEDADEEDQPTWNIWEYDTKTKVLRRVIGSDTTAEEGHDIMPHYLPDGRIVFTSTRQRQSRAILLDENKPQFAAQVEAGTRQPAFVLHVMDADGTNINQITFNQSHDLNPSVMNDGRVIFTHWEQALAGSQMDLYTVNPDGSDLQLLYGAHSHATGTVDPTTGTPSTIQFLGPRAMQDGRTMALVRPYTGTDAGGDLVLIDTANYVDNTRGSSAANSGLPGPAQARALPTDVRTIPGPSPGGRYRSASPLFDGTNRLLVSWSQCRLVEEGRIVPCTSDRLNNTTTPPVEAPPLYGVYIYDVRDNTQKPIVAPQEGFIYSEVVAGSSRALPPVILNRVAGVDYPSDLLSESVGILDIRSVYDIDGVDATTSGIAALSNPASPAYANRTARFLRLEKIVSQPDQDTRDVPNSAFGVAGRRLGMRDILGYAPVEPDGSVRVKVPANVAFSISLLDANGRRLSGRLGQRHSNWLQVTPGETLQCNGCHDANLTPPIAHGRKGLTDSAYPGAASTGAIFPNTNPALAALDIGETMAQARARAMCGPTKACPPSVDIAFDDIWQPTYDPATTAGSFDMCYSTATNILNNPNDLTQKHLCASPGLKTPLPTAATCTTNWTSLCRITINYEKHIHPLWGVERTVDADMNGVPDVDGDGVTINHQCNTCHNPAGANMAQVPGGDIDLTDGPSDDDPMQFKSYRQLLFARTAQMLNAMGQLEPVCAEFQTDPVTLVQTCVRFQQVPASMSGQGALASRRFFDKLEGRTVGTVNHKDFMSPSELRLVSEWLDIGAQYYNDPFAAPEN